MSTITHQRIPSLELGRIIAILAVITIHSQLFVDYPLYKDTPWLGDLINQLSRFAVPYFFLLTGYFLQPKLNQDPVGTALSYIKPIAVVWLVWSAIYLLMPFNLMTVTTEGYVAERSMYWDYLALTPLNSLLEGGLVHLWYLPALAMGVGIIAIIIKTHLQKLLLPFAILLFVYGVLAGSYFNVTDIPSLFYTRNGPFFSLLMITLGFEVRRLNITINSGKAATILIAGMVMHFIEVYCLLNWDVAFRIHDYLFATPIWALGFFFFLLANPTLGDKKWVPPIANLTLGIYVSHLLFIIYLSNLAGFLGFDMWKRDLLVWSGTIVISTLFVYFITKTPLRKVLLR
ncbi:fucose 4-O-acetylase [Vibrio inusitatus NBRC 102082]|uniref:Fucose 4-O-acetylase n=1 Tax=Vibrio inusitatus NBRC 102082 TaxID=1219070 RepID=A0A4Y3HW39_9VIBR|nr:acyltransferase family protein [Vibrio inusitatus]GEA51393.1 fucose 4-O-acetylase [Vibrio inusitatus NBRC 102082]